MNLPISFTRILCSCNNVQHDTPARCKKPATWQCTVCNAPLCKHCADKHHVHRASRPLTLKREL